MAWISNLASRAYFRMSYWSVARRSRIILSAGMPRSGSTWVFNAARLLLRSKGDLGSGWIEDWATIPRAPTVLVKVHAHDPFLARSAHAILYSFRDIRDALASRKRMFGIDPTLEDARQWLKFDRRWREQAAVTVRYESMLADPVGTVADLASALGLSDADPAGVLRQLAQIDHQTPHIGLGAYDRETLLHRGHITDGRHGAWGGWLSPAFVRQLEQECGGWLAENGYVLQTVPTDCSSVASAVG